MENIDLHIQATPKSPKKMNLKPEGGEGDEYKEKSTLAIIVEALKTKNKEKIWKQPKKCFIYRGLWGRITLTCHLKTMAVRRRWNDIFKVLKKNTSQNCLSRDLPRELFIQLLPFSIAWEFPSGINSPALSGRMCVMGEQVPTCGSHVKESPGQGH